MTATCSEIAEALEARAPYYVDWAKDIREVMGTSVDADHSDATAALLRAAAAKLREMELALQPFARAASVKRLAIYEDYQPLALRENGVHADVTLGDLRAARSALSGANE